MRPRRKPTAAPAAPAAPHAAVQAALLAWFAEAQRPLPWRRDYDPYAVWVSEMMLQQTQVETVKPYFARWMARFPDVAALAAAPLGDVLKLWEGLGYYARARNLHRAAQEIAARHGGRIPGDPEALLALPGIGRYSMGAIASIAFNRPLPIVDGNVTRVLTRWFALTEPAASPQGKSALWQLAEALIPSGRARDFNQALMELGALICRPREPVCGLCPVRAHCRAFAEGRPEAYPPPKVRPERRRVAALLAVPVQPGGRVLLRRRPAEGLWGGLWEFPWIEANGAAPDAALAGLLESLHLRTAGDPRDLGEVRHGLTHREFTWRCIAVPVHEQRPRKQGRSQRAAKAANAPDARELRWADGAALAALPLGRPMRKVLALWRAREDDGD